MVYMGGKGRIAKWILPIILKDRQPEQFYVEPFCGGLNTLYLVKGNVIASDVNKYVIAFWKGLQEKRKRRGKITKEIYDAARLCYVNKTNEFTDFHLGWVGFMASYRGKFFGGYCADKERFGEDYSVKQIRSVKLQIRDLKRVHFFNCNYWELKIPKKSIIYCDPPYEGTTTYATAPFDHEKFWNWVRVKSREGHQVFVSEYKAPEDFLCIWKVSLSNNVQLIKNKSPEKNIEKLFVFKETWKRKKKIEIPKLF